MYYRKEYLTRAHREIDTIFRVLFPEHGMAVREEQILLCHEMLDNLLGRNIALCDAGVGIGKTYAYLVACVLMRKYSLLADGYSPYEQRQVDQMLWSRGIGAILTSGTLKTGQGFSHIRKMTGLQKVQRVREYVADSPFEYQKNCLLYLPKDLKKCRRGSQEEAEMIADHIHSLICSTYGHTLVLFTSYHLMGNVYQMLRDEIPFPMIGVWRHSPEEITRFKQTDNAVLFAAGSCWEGVDFPGDMVSSLIIVKLPFAVPDPISEAQKKEFDCLKDYIQAVIVPDMQKKLRQGFGRALRTETDTCVVSILDERAGEDGRYHEEVMCALPSCKMAKDIKDVQRFIRNRKGVEYYL